MGEDRDAAAADVLECKLQFTWQQQNLALPPLWLRWVERSRRGGSDEANGLGSPIFGQPLRFTARQ